MRKHYFEGYYMKDVWGPMDFHRQFNTQYPEQIKLDYSVLLGTSGWLGSVEDERRATRLGIRTIYRGYDEDNVNLFAVNGDYEFMTVVYFTYQF